MKKVGVLLFVLFVCLIGNAQGIYQMWGTTAYGGANAMGAIFRTDASGDNFQIKHHFSAINPGVNPVSRELTEHNGKFYGVTQTGGSRNYGVIFEWDPLTNTYARKIDFTGPDGAYPGGNLTLREGKFYGITQYGGSSNLGVIFEWDPLTNLLTKKLDFNGGNGASPEGHLALKDGKFYSAIVASNSNGIIFEWDPVTNVFTKKVEFDGTNGRSPNGSLLLSNGKFYGMTKSGGSGNNGVIFEWDPATNVLTRKIQFSGINGKTPYGNLTEYSGKFYGMTYEGGGSNYGVIFEWDPASQFTSSKVHFNSNGRNPYGGLTMSGGKFYGMTYLGGSSLNGVLFEWDPVTNVYTKKIDFNGVNNGALPVSNFTIKEGKLYGMTKGGGSGTAGVIFEWDPVTNVYTKKIDFNLNDGSLPTGGFTWTGGKLYGMTLGGGGANAGTIFEWDPANNSYTKKAEFNVTNGKWPCGRLTMSNGKYYGMTMEGGNNVYYGVIFEWDPVTNTLTKKVDLDNPNGRSPRASLTAFNNRLYGMTYYGGNKGWGALFEYFPGSTFMIKKIDFTGANGAFPAGSLISSDGKFYGTTTGGIAAGLGGGLGNNHGTIFEWDPVTNTHVQKFAFDEINGSSPIGDLVLNEGKYYGIATAGGSAGTGILFEWDPATNIYTKKFDFNNVNKGIYPVTSLTLSNGRLYGMTQDGGSNNQGVLFEWDPATNMYTKKLDFNGVNGRGSSNELIRVPAPVAKGLPGNCINFSSINVDISNNNTWVPIKDNDGNAVAEIKANGNNLGVVSASMFINDGAVREDNAKRLYLDRNITITPQFQPSSPVDIRLYIRNSEYMALKNAMGSNGQSSGINTINDVGIFKNPVNSCSPGISENAHPVVTTVSNWENDNVLSASITSFSSFYFANKSFATLPLNLLEFKGRLENNNALLSWKTDNEQNTSHFEIERSTDGFNYTTAGNVLSANARGVHQYHFTDPSIASLGAATVNYRLKQVDIGGEFNYSHVVPLTLDNTSTVLLYPNPVSDKATIYITSSKAEHLDIRIIDNLGRVVIQQQSKVSAGNTSVSIDVKHLSKGIYYFDIKGTSISKQFSFIKP